VTRSSGREISRRGFVKTVVTAGAVTSAWPWTERARAQQVPNSSGAEPPKLRAPRGACDCHHHIYDAARFPPANPASRLQTAAAVADYRMLQRRIGTSRSVVVTPAAYATDNRVTVDAIRQLGPSSRGVAVVHPDVTGDQLQTFAAAGIRGIRFTLADAATAVTTVDMIAPLARRVADLGWHVQLNLRADQIVAMENLLLGLPTALVFDHMGHVPQPAPGKHASFNVIRKLIDKGSAWVKLSGAYLNSEVGSPYVDASALARAYVKAAPERMVWGSDWPHPTEAADKKPDDALLFDLLSDWAPDEAMRHRILVENPERLYGFAQLA